MSTTVTYKGSTLTTVDNQTRTLKTAGKYMEGDVVLTDVTSSGGVPHVWQDANGYVHLDDEGTTQIVVEPLSVTQNGTYTATTGHAYSPVTVNVSGGMPAPTPWVRPSDWPDLSQMDVSAGDIIYMTSYADEARGFCNIYVTCTGSYTVEAGTISGSTFMAESTHTVSSGTRCKLYYGSANGTFKVLRVTGTAITNFKIGGDTSAITIDTFYGYTSNNGIIDVVGKLPSCTGMSHSSCCNLVNMKIDDVVLSGNMGSMFNYCTSLTSLDVSNWNTSAVTNMSNMFYNCYSLTSLDVSDWNTSTVTNMSYMFFNCYSLTSLDVSNWNTSAVTNMSNMFCNCYSLTSLDVSGWNTSAVTNMNNMFGYCTSLTSLDVSNWDTSAVTNMSYMFSYCHSLTSLDVSGWDFSEVTTASNTSSMFRYCRGLHGSITIPSSITQIGTYFLADTRSLHEYHFLSTTPPTLTNANAFSYMDDFGGKKIYVPSASLTAYQTASNWSTYASYMQGE